MTTPVSIAPITPVPKRARSQDPQRLLNSSLAPGTSSIIHEDNPDLPAFLRQSRADIHAKFELLELQQQLRIAQGRTNPSSRWVQEMSPQVKLRNRYLNVQPWEKSRIHLKVAEGKSDYINASPICLRDPSSAAKTTFIAAQGPKQTGISHFWHMIWQETKDVAVIVMLTQTAEGGKEKCYQYFPLDAHTEPYQIDPIGDEEDSLEGSVAFVEATEDQVSRTTIRKLLLTFGDESRTIWHLLFCGWPDFAVPEGEDRRGLLALLTLSAEKNSVPNNPRIIHCSAGVGRSGTFIALEHLLSLLESGATSGLRDDSDMIFDVVNNLREQRMTMVQSEAQYQFLYQTIREQLEKWQVAAKDHGDPEEPSPKFRRLAGDMISVRGEVRAKGEATSDQDGFTTLAFANFSTLVCGVLFAFLAFLGVYFFGS